MTFPTACSGVPLTPAGFVASSAGNVVSISWNPPTSAPAPTSYVLNVTAINPCGAGAPTAPRTVVVP